jgi:hypothetical protein
LIVYVTVSESMRLVTGVVVFKMVGVTGVQPVHTFVDVFAGNM